MISKSVLPVHPTGVLSLWRNVVSRANSHGIPLPMVRDPKTGRGSITATLVVLSSCLAALSIIMMLAVFVAKITSWFVLTDTTLSSVKEAFSASMQFYIASLAAYLGRKIQSNKNAVSVSSEEKPQ